MNPTDTTAADTNSAGTYASDGNPVWMRAPELTETTTATETVYRGRIFTLESLTVTLPDGNAAKRDVIRHPGATAVMAFDPSDRVLLTNQWRTSLGRVSTEIPAGTLEAGEDPIACATREFEEETGLSAGPLEHVTSITTCAGFCDEVLHIYRTATVGAASGAHVADHDEFIETVWVPFDELVSAVLAGHVTDSKTAVAVLAEATRRAAATR